MGRPKSANDQLLSISIRVRLSKSQKAMIIQKANKNHMSLSRYIRETAISSDDTRLPKIRLTAIMEIRKIGVNINQITHHINHVSEFGGSINYTEINKTLKEYHILLNEILKNLII